MHSRKRASGENDRRRIYIKCINNIKSLSRVGAAAGRGEKKCQKKGGYIGAGQKIFQSDWLCFVENCNTNLVCFLWKIAKKTGRKDGKDAFF